MVPQILPLRIPYYATGGSEALFVFIMHLLCFIHAAFILEKTEY